MQSHIKLARFLDKRFIHEKIHIDEKIIQSARLLRKFSGSNKKIQEDITKENFRLGIVPRLSPFDVQYFPKNTKFVQIPTATKNALLRERAHDLIAWNKPSQFLHRLNVGKTTFIPPVLGHSHAMERLTADRMVVSFDDLRTDSPIPKNGRQSRSDLNSHIEVNIMGQGRVPFALGSVPDVGSFLSYTTVAMSNGMVFVSRDKLLADISHQASLVKDIIDFLKTVELPREIFPNSQELAEFIELMNINPKKISQKEELNKYIQALRDSWVANVGAAIEASSSGILRAKELHRAGCRLFRIYSPEGGTEIVSTTKTLRETFKKSDSVKIVGGQIMDTTTARKAEAAGCDAIFIGVAGGSQCTTSVNADIPVKTPNLLYSLRGNISIPVGIEGGGVGTHLMTAYMLGASFVSKPGEIGVSWEGAGGEFMFKDLAGDYYMPYGGEASISAKWWKDSVDPLGRPKFVEGETGVRHVKSELMSLTRNIKKLRDQVSVGLVFQRSNSISELHARDCDNIVQVTPDASALSQAYAK